MKKQYSYLLSAASALLLFAALNGCEKDYLAPQPEVSKNFSESFDTVANLYNRGWVFNNNSRPQGAASWQQGVYGIISGKTGFSFDGFPAFQYKHSPDEYVFAGYASGAGSAVLSSWMMTPPLEMKNGDKISFYARSIGSTPSRLQVRLNAADNSSDVGFSETTVGKFTTLIADINSAQTGAGFPQTWTRFEYTLAGLPAPIKRRIAFRYFVNGGTPNNSNANAIGVDEFRLESQ